MNSESWEKYPHEKLLVGKDWTKDLAGTDINGVPTIEVIGDATLTCTFAENEGNISKFWLEGGNDQAFTAYVKLLVSTTEEELVGDIIQVRVKRD